MRSQDGAVLAAIATSLLCPIIDSTKLSDEQAMAGSLKPDTQVNRVRDSKFRQLEQGVTRDWEKSKQQFVLIIVISSLIFYKSFRNHFFPFEEGTKKN